MEKGAYTAAIVVSKAKKDCIVFFDINNQKNTTILQPEDSDDNITTYDNFVVYGSNYFGANSTGVYSISGNPYSSKLLIKDINSVYISTVLTMNNNKVLLIVNREGRFFRVSIYDYSNSKNISQKSLPSDVNWSLCDLSLDGSTLFFAGEVENSSKIGILKNECPSNSEELDVNWDYNYIDVSIKIRQIVALSNSEMLALDYAGQLFLIKTTCAEPILLKHQEWTKSQDSKIVLGANGWFALAAKKNLAMWQLGREGHIYPYSGFPSSLDISLVEVETLVATRDGRYLFGLHASKNPDQFYTWEFPRYAIDGM